MPTRIKKRVLFAGLVAALVAVQLGLMAWRGIASGPVPSPPTKAGDGTLAALVDLGEGRKAAWASRVVDRPVAEVWAVITDYPAFPRIFPFLSQVSSRPDAAGTTVELDGTAAILGMSIPFKSEIHHQPGPPVPKVSWDTPTAEVPVNRGSWTLEPVGPGSTRVTYQLELELRGWSAVAVRAYLRDNLGALVGAVADEATARGRGAR